MTGAQLEKLSMLIVDRLRYETIGVRSEQLDHLFESADARIEIEANISMVIAKFLREEGMP